MEVIKGSIYVEIESVVGIFCTAATPATTAFSANVLRPHRSTQTESSSSSSNTRASSRSSLHEEAMDAAAPLKQRAVSSHSPFGPAPSAFAELSPHSNGISDKGNTYISAGDAAGRSAGPHRHHAAAASPSVSTSVFPNSFVDGPPPPALSVHFGCEVHVIDMASLSTTTTTTATATGYDVPLSGPGPVLVSPTRGIATDRVSIAPKRSDRGHAEMPQHSASGSSGEARNSSGASSNASITAGHVGMWEGALNVVDDLNPSEQEDNERGGDNGSQHTPPLPSSATAPRSFYWDSASSVAESEEAHLCGAAGQREGNSSAAGSPAGRHALPPPSRSREGRIAILASPAFASPTYPAVSPPQSTLLGLVEHLRNDAAAQSALTWVGPRPLPRLRGRAGDASAAVSAFVSAWYASLFPESGDGRNVLYGDVQALQAARRGLTAGHRHLTAATFPLSQRFSITKATIEVRSSAAFDLQEAMQCNTRGGKASSGHDADGMDDGCLVIRLATPAEVKKARRAASKGTSAAFKKTNAVEHFFEHLRGSFRGHRSKEKTASAKKSVDGEKCGVHLHGHAAHTHLDALAPHPQPQHGEPPRRNDQSLASASSAKEFHTARTSTHRKEAAHTDAFSVRLHLSRLLSPSILAWMKGRHAAIENSGSSDDVEKEEALRSVRSGERSGRGNGQSPDDRVDFRTTTTTTTSTTAPAGRLVRDDPDGPAAFAKSVYVPLPPPVETAKEQCVVMMLKVNVVFKPGLDSAEPF